MAGWVCVTNSSRLGRAGFSEAAFQVIRFFCWQKLYGQVGERGGRCVSWKGVCMHRGDREFLRPRRGGCPEERGIWLLVFGVMAGLEFGV